MDCRLGCRRLPHASQKWCPWFYPRPWRRGCWHLLHLFIHSFHKHPFVSFLCTVVSQVGEIPAQGTQAIRFWHFSHQRALVCFSGLYCTLFHALRLNCFLLSLSTSCISIAIPRALGIIPLDFLLASNSQSLAWGSRKPWEDGLLRPGIWE